MRKKKGVIWEFFNIKRKGVVCKYCTLDYKQANAYKIEKHINKYFKYPFVLKFILKANAKTKSTTKTLHSLWTDFFLRLRTVLQFLPGKDADRKRNLIKTSYIHLYRLNFQISALYQARVYKQ